MYGREIAEYKAPDPKRQPELMLLKKIYGIQRRREDVMRWIPKVDYVTLKLPMTAKQRKAYEEISEFFMLEKENGELELVENIPAQIMKLRQLCLNPSIAGPELPSPKAEWLAERLKSQAGQVEPTLIFTFFASYIPELKKRLEKEGLRIGTISGATKRQEDHKTKTAFQNGDLDVLLLQINKCKEGLTLDRAETVIFLDRLYSPSFNEQAEDRFIPTKEENADKNMQVINLIMENSIDEILYDILESKLEFTQIINKFKTYKEFLNWYEVHKRGM
jgi:SNF2 family DNA or RNA helicase